MPDVLGLALVLRLGVVVPLIIIALPVSRAFRRASWNLSSELTKAAVAVVVLASQAVVLVVARSPLASNCTCGFFPVMTYFALTLRTRLSVVVGTLVAMVAVAAVGTTASSVMLATTKSQVISVLLATAALPVVMVVSREADLRRSFLLRSQARLLIGERDAALAALHQASAELAELTELDELTRVPNRRALVARLQDWDASGAWGAVVMVDVDHLKSINDRYGHAAGDACLRSVAGALSVEARVHGGVVARYGGEEFVVLLPGVPALTGPSAVEGLRRAVAEAATHSGLALTVSAGWAAACAGEGTPAQVLLLRADEAALAAKAAGRDRSKAWSASTPQPSSAVVHQRAGGTAALLPHV